MKTARDLERQLASIDRRGYPAYKSLRGAYDFDGILLTINHVQGDPFATPSQLSVFVPSEMARLPRALYSVHHRRTALEDHLIRRFGAEATRVSYQVSGSGKSGLIATSKPGPEVLERSACTVDDYGGVTIRLEAGLPAHGRAIDGRAAAHMLLDLIPDCAERALLLDDADLRRAQEAVDLADDQAVIRRALKERGLVAFVADGSVLPRATGVSAKPLADAKPFTSPDSMRVTLDLPHRGMVSGMGIRRGVTLIVGGGYHGKSTLLKALQEGVYDHVAGDGRELVATDASAVKLRAEDGRIVRAVDISPFINNLPNGRNTREFSTLDASGSTSQAAGAAEALEAGSRVLLIDEDTSATNFMVRDALMEAVVAAEQEPITPFVERVRELWERGGVSCVLIVGSSGAFFPVADTVVQMDHYEASDITPRVRTVLAEMGLAAPSAGGVQLDAAGEGGLASAGANEGTRFGSAPTTARCPLVSVPGASRGRDGKGRGRGEGHRRGEGRGHDAVARLKVRPHGLDGFSVGHAEADLRLVEQLVDAEQSASLAQMVRLVLERGMLDGKRTTDEAVNAVFAELAAHGWDALAPYGDASCGFAMPRRQELFAVLNRLRV